MGLCNVYSYLNDSKIGKTIKLSDSYQVRIRLEDWDFAKSDVLANKNKYALNMEIPDNNEIELFECTSVTLPSYKTKEDIFTYGNNSKSFIYMDPTSLDDLEIELIEHYNSENTLTVEGLVNLFLAKLFDEDKFEYILNEYIPELTVYVFSNIFDTVYLKYIFKELKLTDYSKYTLDYSSTDIAKWTLKFSYRSFYVIAGEEEEYSKELIDNANNVPNIDTETDAEETAPEPEPMGNESPLTEPDIPASEPPLPTNDETTEHPSEGSTPSPDPSNTSLQNEFNSAGGVPTGSAQTNENIEQTSGEVATDTEEQSTNTELVLDNVDIKSTGDDNPVDLEALSPEDRTDELAYRMMRGQLDNGKPRYGKTYEAGYTEEERAKAQNIVNELDWEGLKERHDARVANMLNTDNEHAASEDNKPTNNNVAVTEEVTTDSTPELTVLSEPIEQDPIKEPISETHKPEESTASTGPKISKEKLAKAGISKADPNERKYQGLTSTQWGEIAAKQDMQDGLRDDNKGLNYDMLYCNGEIEKDKFKTGYEDYMSRNNKDSKTKQVAQTEQPEPKEVKEQPKQEVKKQTIVKQNPDLITLTEADIDKYVPFLYKAAARGYFNKYKDEQGTLTLVVNEKMIDDNVPSIFRSTAKKAYKEYMADHPKQN